MHGDLLQQLPEPALKCIGWRRCVQGCGELFMGHNAFHTHIASCLHYISSQAHQQSQSTTPPVVPLAPLPRDRPEYQLLFSVCPPIRYDELDTLIKSGTEETELMRIVIEWAAEANAAKAAESSDSAADPSANDNVNH